MDNKIIQLILILVIVVLISSFVKYEHFNSTFKLMFKESNDSECVPTVSDFEDNKFKIRICNDFGVKIKVFMRTGNNVFENSLITHNMEKCINIYSCQGNNDTRVVDIEKDEHVEFSFPLSQDVISLSMWMIKMDDDTMDGNESKMIDKKISFFEKTADGPSGTTSFELTVVDKVLDYNISYVEAISSSINTSLYVNSPDDLIKSGCDLPNNPISTSGELKRYKFLGMNRIFASKYKPNIKNCIRDNDDVCELLDPGLLIEDDDEDDTKYDACGNNRGLNTSLKHKCRTHIADKIQNENTYCGYLFKNNCPYSWAYGEYICIDPDVFNSTPGSFKDKLLKGGLGPKAVNCGYNDDSNSVEDHFNWPNLTDIGGPIIHTDTNPEDKSSGIKPTPIPDEETMGMGKFWYNTKKGCVDKSNMRCRSPFDTIDGIPNILDKDINVGSLSGNSLNHIKFQDNDSIILNISFKKISWL